MKNFKNYLYTFEKGLISKKNHFKQAIQNIFIFHLFSRMDDNNPWKVESIEAFYFLKCPECNFFTKEDKTFYNHAVENHSLSFVLFGKPAKNKEHLAQKGILNEDVNFQLKQTKNCDQKLLLSVTKHVKEREAEIVVTDQDILNNYKENEGLLNNEIKFEDIEIKFEDNGIKFEDDKVKLEGNEIKREGNEINLEDNETILENNEIIVENNENDFFNDELSDELTDEMSDELSDELSDVLSDEQFEELLYKQPDEIIFGHPSYNPEAIMKELVHIPETTHKIPWKKPIVLESSSNDFTNQKLMKQKIGGNTKKEISKEIIENQNSKKTHIEAIHDMASNGQAQTKTRIRRVPCTCPNCKNGVRGQINIADGKPMYGSCHFDRALNDEFSVDILIIHTLKVP